MHLVGLGAMIAVMRDLVSVLADVNDALRAIQHYRDGISPENPLDAMHRLGELADELDQFRVYASDPDADETPTR